MLQFVDLYMTGRSSWRSHIGQAPYLHALPLVHVGQHGDHLELHEGHQNQLGLSLHYQGETSWRTHLVANHYMPQVGKKHHC